MKLNKIFSIVFILGAILALAIGSPLAAAVAVGGAYLAANPPKLGKVAYLNIVPGKIMVPVGDAYQEVPAMSRAEKALYDQLITLGRSNPVTADVIRQGGISFDPITYYIRYAITGLSGTQDIVNQATQQIYGITNFPNNAALPQYYNMCFDRIAVRYASTNTANANVASMTGWSSVRSSMPAALGNGHLIVQSNQNKILDTPVSDFTSVAAITGGGERDYDGGLLEKPRFFLELINLTVQLRFATGQTAPSNANNTFAVEVMFYGVQARLKA